MCEKCRCERLRQTIAEKSNFLKSNVIRHYIPRKKKKRRRYNKPWPKGPVNLLRDENLQCDLDRCVKTYL